jgi:hypothetical protein
VAGIKRHPWFNRQLPSQYGGALEQLAREQKAIDQQVRLCVRVCVCVCVCVCVWMRVCFM